MKRIASCKGPVSGHTFLTSTSGLLLAEPRLSSEERLCCQCKPGVSPVQTGALPLTEKLVHTGSVAPQEEFCFLSSTEGERVTCR